MDWMHPLTEIDTVEFEGDTIDVINSWGFASMVVASWMEGSDGATLAMRDLLFASEVPDLEIEKIVSDRSPVGEARLRQLVNWVEAGIANKLETAFRQEA